jgi:intermembrane space import and assembly protein 40
MQTSLVQPSDSETLSASLEPSPPPPLPPPSDVISESQAVDDVDEKADGAPQPPPSEEGEAGEEGSAAGGAFDPVTGKINWDCPCLGGMAHGPCGMQFREAFSCFVFSEQEPKGIDCVEKFKAMQDCFRENPDVYGEGTFTVTVNESPTTTLPPPPRLAWLVGRLVCLITFFCLLPQP